VSARGVARLEERVGLPAKQKERSFWVIGGSQAAFEAAAPIIEAVGARFARLRIILSGPDPLLDWLTLRFPSCAVQAIPRLAARRYVRRSNFRAAAALEDVPLSRSLLRAIADEGLTLVALRARDRAAEPTADVRAAAEAVVAIGEGLSAAGPDRALGRETGVGFLGEILARDIKIRRKAAQKVTSLPAALLRVIETPIGRRALARRLRRIGGAGELFEEIGRPKSILCLGNGPSSEDPAVAAAACDALFRVNHSWAERGLLTSPDVVFTGGTPTMARLDGVIFGVQSAGAEKRLVGARFLRPGRGRTRFFRVGSVAPGLAAFDWGAVRPTNGAAMLAVAVAFKPQRLVVAGIDLFRHPAGAYPGDDATPNAFAPAHDPDAELNFLLDLFEQFQGELVVVGDVLRAAIDARKVRASS
jgi:hypothetical protein